MRTRQIALLAAGIVMLVSSAARAQAPDINIPAELLRINQLGPEQTKQIDAYVGYWLGAMATAKTETAMLQAQTALLGGYNKYDNAAYRNEYAGVLSKRAAAALPKMTKPANTVAAFGLAEIHEPVMQGALDVMVKDDTDAVRYLGWRGFLAGNMRVTLLASPNARKQLLDTLAARSAKEDSPAVMAAIADTLRMPPVPPELLADKDYKAVQAQCFKMLQDMWPRMCHTAISGNIEMALASGRVVESAEYFAAAVDPKDKSKALQMLMDMLHCAVLAYDNAGATGPTAEAFGQLAVDAEAALSRASGVSRTTVQAAVSQPEVSGRSLAAQEAVLGWVDSLKDQGVKKPDIKAPATQGSTVAPK